jgi:hypothetical protein
MLHQHSDLSTHSFQQATKLASNGEEYSHLIKLMEPEHALRLKLFIQELPEELACKSIYGKTHWKEQSEAKQRKRK